MILLPHLNTATLCHGISEVCRWVVCRKKHACLIIMYLSEYCPYVPRLQRIKEFLEKDCLHEFSTVMLRSTYESKKICAS